MPADESSRTELGNTGYELFVGALSVLSLINIVCSHCCCVTRRSKRSSA